MGLKKFFNNIFNKPRIVQREPYPASFHNQYTSPNPPEINFIPDELKILTEWQLDYESDNIIGVGEAGETLIICTRPKSEPGKWTARTILEKKNFERLLQLLEDLMQGKTNRTSSESILDADPDAIKIFSSSDRYETSHLMICNMRDIVINGKRTSTLYGHFISFDLKLTSSFISGLSALLTPEQRAEAYRLDVENRRAEMLKAS